MSITVPGITDNEEMKERSRQIQREIESVVKPYDMPEIKRSSHGSQTEDEMAARMRDAGYEEWEIQEELSEARAISSPDFDPTAHYKRTVSAYTASKAKRSVTPVSDKARADMHGRMRGNAATNMVQGKAI